MHILDSQKFKEVLKKRGYRSIGELASDLGIHRNTIHHYLSGNSVFPQNLEKILNALRVDFADIITEKDDRSISTLEQIAPLIDELHKEFPTVTFILFGSRKKGTARKYSDWDIGVFSSVGLPHEKYRKILRRSNELSEDLPFFVDMINLNNADIDFLREISGSWQFLTGKVTDRLYLERQVAA